MLPRAQWTGVSELNQLFEVSPVPSWLCPIEQLLDPAARLAQYFPAPSRTGFLQHVRRKAIKRVGKIIRTTVSLDDYSISDLETR
jgi:hypothetical protein